MGRGSGGTLAAFTPGQFLAFSPCSCSGSMHTLVLGEECGDSRLDIGIHGSEVMTFVLCMEGLAPPVFEVLEAKADSLLPVTLTKK